MANNVNNPQYGYPQGNGYPRSYDNMAAMSTNGSGNTDSYGQSTDPSSLNSSNDQLQQQALQQQRLDERAQAEYGFNGFGGTKNSQPMADPNWGGPVGGGMTPMGAGTVPMVVSTPRKETLPSPAEEKPDKRKSWFKRRFSKD